jgi:hypothetical protein
MCLRIATAVLGARPMPQTGSLVVLIAAPPFPAVVTVTVVRMRAATSFCRWAT